MTTDTKPALSVRAALQTLLDQVDFTAHACSPTSVVAAVLPTQVIDNARASLAAPFGLPLTQETKYTVDDFGRIVNRETGVPIPDDEPVMLFRAKDDLARVAVLKYADTVAEEGGTNSSKHAATCFERYQRFVLFREQHRDRMRKPD